MNKSETNALYFGSSWIGFFVATFAYFAIAKHNGWHQDMVFLMGYVPFAGCLLAVVWKYSRKFYRKGFAHDRSRYKILTFFQVPAMLLFISVPVMATIYDMGDTLLVLFSIMAMNTYNIFAGMRPNNKRWYHQFTWNDLLGFLFVPIGYAGMYGWGLSPVVAVSAILIDAVIFYFVLIKPVADISNYNRKLREEQEASDKK